jgi:hypothetical protein
MSEPALLHADPDKVEAAAKTLAEAGAHLEGHADRVPADLSEDIWRGEAKKAFSEAAKRQADRMRLGAGAHKAGADAMYWYAQALRAAQWQAQTAWSTYLRARAAYQQLLPLAQAGPQVVNEINHVVGIANRSITTVKQAIQQVNVAATRLHEDLNQAAHNFR